VKRVIAVMCLSAYAIGCGSSSSTTSPSATVPTSAPSPTVTYTLSGTVSDQQTRRGIQSAAVQIPDGPNANKAAVTAADGSFSLPGLTAGDLTVRVAATGYTALTQTMTLTGDRRFDAALQGLTRTITGTVTDETSGGILPGIQITVVSGPSAGQSTKTDGNGNYTLAGISADPAGLSASATSYVASNKVAAAGGNTRVDFVLFRAATTPTPTPTPAGPAAGSAVIGFGAIGGGLPYSEAGFTIVSTLATWVSIKTYGNPLPYIEFFNQPGVTVDGEVKVTAGGAIFRFSAVDLYSSTTQIPYVFTGLLNNTVVFAVSGRQGNTFGNFATIANPQESVPIDTLLIHLTNPGGSGTNPMGIDNLVMK
jgi:hypothetical protein